MIRKFLSGLVKYSIPYTGTRVKKGLEAVMTQASSALPTSIKLQSIMFHGQDPVMHGVLTVVEVGEKVQAFSSAKGTVQEYNPEDLVTAEEIANQLYTMLLPTGPSSSEYSNSAVRFRAKILVEALSSTELTVKG